MDRFTGGCLCGNVRIKPRAVRIGLASVTASTVASITARSSTLPLCFHRMP